MRIDALLAIFAALAAVAIAPPRLHAAEDDGVALAIVYDTSGSMDQTVPDKDGRPAHKYVIANRALIATAKQLQNFATNSTTGSPRRIETGLFIFNSPGAREVVNFGPFDAAAIENWAKGFASPAGNTPLGNAIFAAAQKVLRSPLSRKHVLVITDGMSNAGPPPEMVMPRLKGQAEQKQTQIAFHFVAFDVGAKVFDPVKKLGATVVGAADEQQLDNQLRFILEKKILLEEEEPVKR